MEVTLQYRVICPFIYDRIMYLHKTTAKRKVTIKRKYTFNLKIKICVVS